MVARPVEHRPDRRGWHVGAMLGRERRCGALQWGDSELGRWVKSTKSQLRVGLLP